MTRLILHLGAHKTGTTATQSILRKNKELLARNGILSIIERKEILGDNTLSYLTESGFSRQLKSMLSSLTTRKDCDVIIYSFEGNFGVPYPGGRDGFYPHATAGLQRLADATVGDFDDVSVYYSVRSHADLIESYYAQRVKEGHAITFSGFLRRFLSGLPSWKPIVDKMVELFGKENVYIQDYSKYREKQDFGILRDGIGLEGTEVRRNESYGRVGINIALKILPHVNTDEQKLALRRFITQAFPLSSGKLDLFSDHEREILDEMYRDDLRYISSVLNNPNTRF